MSDAAKIFDELGFDAHQVQLPEGVMVYAIARTYGLIMRRLSETYRRFRLSAAGFNVLLLLKRGKDPDSFTQREIGKRLVVSPSDMSGLIDRMARRGLVRRLPGKDRRSHLLQVTARGARLVEQVWPHHDETIKRMTHGIEAGDAAALLRVLAHLRQSMGV